MQGVDLLKTLAKAFGWVIGILATLAVVILLFPESGGKHWGPRVVCLSNIKQVANGLQIYAADADGRLPSDAWMDRLEPYIKNQEIYRCSEVEKEPDHYGYAMNSSLAGEKMSDSKNPATIPLIYDSSNLRRNASDPFASLPRQPRHSNHTKNNIGYLDGHAKSIGRSVAHP